jgi:regulator of cell morphogenesis and NO signaling
MTIDTNKTVREIAVEIPSATRVFEKLGIDYCCGGGKGLGDACVQAKLPVDQVLRDLQQAESSRIARQENARDWSREPLADVIGEILHKHHAFVKAEIPRLSTLAEKVSSKHGERHPETLKVNDLFSDLANELSMHLMKEEQILFPYMIRMEEAVVAKEPMIPSSCFGTVQNPISMMVSEHDGAGETLRVLREVTDNYKVPDDACTSYRTLYTGLLEFEADLHQHIHLENNILFPRAIAMEEGR